MTPHKLDAPFWLKRALLGVCFWVGHRRALYREYPLGESAMVAELCNLIFANLPHGMRLLCETRYSKFLPVHDRETQFTEKSRVDLCICGAVAKGENPLQNVLYALEVKRSSASTHSIEMDLERLLKAKKAHPGLRTFLLLISESKRPASYVTEKGFAKKGRLPIKNTDGHCRVRAAMKAISAVRNLDTGHYACAIEVLLPKPVK